MTTIKADPAELRRLASDLRHSAAHLRQLGDQAVGAAASAHSPAAAGTMAEAASFAAGAHVGEIQTGVLATGTERVADLFEAADRGGGWFSRSTLTLAGNWGFGLFGAGKKLFKLYQNLPHGFGSKWHAWQKATTDARTKIGRYWGNRDPRKAIMSWGRAQRKILSNPKDSVTKFLKRGERAAQALGKNTSILRRVAPLTKFATKVAGKVLKPLNVIQSYRDSKAPNVAGKLTSVAFSTFVTKNPVGMVVDLATGGQVSKGVDGVVDTIFSAGDSDRMNKMAQANKSGENGWAMQGIQAAGDGLADGIYNGWSWLSHGH